MSDIFSQQLDRELDWNDEITKESSGFILLPEGEYDFEVMQFERARHPGSDKLPPCNKAILSITITAPEGTANIKHNLFLHSRTEGIVSAFFISIGQKKHDEPLRMNWQAVPGAKGRCKLGIKTWIGNNGEEMKSNEIKRFLEPVGNAAPQASGFVPGKF